MTQYRKKPLTVNAFQWNPKNKASNTRPKWLTKYIESRTLKEYLTHAVINSPNGKLHLQNGDWIIEGLNGEIYPCPAKVFELTYEEVCPSTSEKPGPVTSATSELTLSDPPKAHLDGDTLNSGNTTTTTSSLDEPRSTPAIHAAEKYLGTLASSKESSTQWPSSAGVKPKGRPKGSKNKPKDR